jgi:tetratricopeptide (TPR) repeat protein
MYLSTLQLLSGLFLFSSTGVSQTMTHFDEHWNYNAPEKTRQLFLQEKNKLSLDSQPALYLELLTQLARTHSLQAQFKEAHQLLDQVQLHWDKATPVVKVRYFLERGRTFNSAKEKDQAMVLFESALALAQEHQLAFYAVDAAHMLGIAAPAEAQMQWNLKAIELAENAKEERAKNWLGSLYNNLGWTYHELGDYQKALAFFEKTVVWHEQKQSKEGLLIAKWSVARAHRSLGAYQEALQQQTELMQERQRLNLTESGYVYEEMAENLQALHRETEAQPYFEKAYLLLSQDLWLQKHEAPRLERLTRLGQS